MHPKAAASCTVDLIQNEQYSQALEILERGVEGVEQFSDWDLLLKPFETLPKHFLAQPRWALVYSAVLVGLRHETDILMFSDQFLPFHSLPEKAPILSDRAWALINQDRYPEAQEILEQALPHLDGWRLGVAWRRLAQCRFEIGGDWKAALDEAHHHLNGRLLGLSRIVEGDFWMRLGNYERAQEGFYQALPHLEMDTFHLAWVHHALGLAYMREPSHEAEQHFIKALHLSHQKTAATFKSRAYQGLGSFRRILGEWERAEAAYHEAIRNAQEADDLRVAYWTLGRCYRLQGKYSNALEAAHKSLQLYPSEQNPAQVERAAVLLAQGKLEAALSTLRATEGLRGSLAPVVPILAAEIARRLGQGEESLKRLSEVQINLAFVREEVRCWPQLFELAKLAGQSVPEPLEYPSQTKVRVEALGALQVFINGRDIGIKPTSRVGELLVLLVENGRQASSEHLIEYLWPQSDPKQKRQALWQLVQELRHILGWPGSIEALGKLYRLDRHSIWEYDVAEARSKRKAHAGFLEGIYSEWALEVAREIEELRAWGEVDSRLN